jgi:hypothetical protein
VFAEQSIRTAAAVIASVLALPVAAATAAQTWLPSLDVTPAVDRTLVDGYTFPVAVTLDARGNATLVLVRDEDGSSPVLQATYRPRGSSWGSPATLSASGENVVGTSAAANRAGDAVAVWSGNLGAGTRVRSSFRSVAGAWQPPIDLSATGQIISGPDVAIDPHGNAMAMWADNSGVRAAYRPAGSTWKAPTTVSTLTSAWGPEVQMDESGRAIAVWTVGTANGPHLYGTRQNSSGVWEKPVHVSPPGFSVSGYDLAVDPAGNATVVYSSSFDDGSGTPTGSVHASFRPMGNTWLGGDQISAVGDDADTPHIALDPHGNAIASWRNASAGSVEAAFRPVGGSFGAPAELGRPGTFTSPNVAFDAEGNAIAVWASLGDGTRAAHRPAASGIWQTPVYVSSGLAFAPEVALDDQGNAVAAWQWLASLRNGGLTTVQAAGFDAAGPTLDALSIPSSGLVGHSLSFNVTPNDVWSTLGVTSWDFGDGGTATGTNAAHHEYQSAGTYTVRVSSIDGLGNTSTESRTVDVSAPPGSAPAQPSPVAGPVQPASIIQTPGVAQPLGTGATAPTASAGTSASRCRVPAVTGATLSTAVKRLKKAGCTYAVRRIRATTRQRRIVRTQPAAGGRTSKPVTLYVSLGPRGSA